MLVSWLLIVHSVALLILAITLLLMLKRLSDLIDRIVTDERWGYRIGRSNEIAVCRGDEDAELGGRSTCTCRDLSK